MGGQLGELTPTMEFYILVNTTGVEDTDFQKARVRFCLVHELQESYDTKILLQIAYPLWMFAIIILFKLNIFYYFSFNIRFRYKIICILSWGLNI